MQLQNCSSAARLLLCFGLLAGAVLSAAPASAQVKSFRDWVAACDNQRGCNAYGW